MENSEDMEIKNAEFQKLLLWYPRAWRNLHGEALIGTYLDYAEHRGITTPTLSDKVTFCLSGLKERFFTFERTGTWTRFWLFMGLLYSVLYTFAISWAPGINTQGSIGPFANPAVITATLVTLAWVFAILNARRAAARMSALSFLANITFCFLGGALNWLGPSPWASVIFAFFTSVPWVKIKF